MVTKRGSRSDYTPSVRPRAAREDGRRRLTPGYLEDLSDTKHHYTIVALGVTTRENLVTPSTGFALRLIRVKLVQDVADGLRFFEVYFGTGTDIVTDQTKAIDVLSVPNLGEATTRTWGRGTGPVGAREERLSIRPTSATGVTHRVLIEYTVERAR